MKTVKILETFDGYPNGKRRTFVSGTEIEIAGDYADLIVAKGHAREIAPKIDDKPAAVAEEKKDARK